jgi:hypothetical protein
MDEIFKIFGYFNVFQIVEHNTFEAVLFLERIQSKNETFPKNIKIPFLVNFCQF